MKSVIESHGFTYDGTDDIAEAERTGDAARVAAKKAFWADVAEVAKLKGDAAAGEAGFGTVYGLSQWCKHEHGWCYTAKS